MFDEFWAAVLASGSGLRRPPGAGCLVIIAAALEAPTAVPGFDDIAVMVETIEQRGRHFGVREDARPFTVTMIEVRSWSRLTRWNRN